MPLTHQELLALAEERRPDWPWAKLDKEVGWPKIKMAWPIAEEVLLELEKALQGDLDAACTVLSWYRVLPTPESSVQLDIVAAVSLGFRCLGIATSEERAGNGN